MTHKVDLNGWQIRDALKKIVEKNCEEVPYEGTDVDKSGIVDDILSFFIEGHYSILKHEKNDTIRQTNTR